MTALCAICQRAARGFGFKPPRPRVDCLGGVSTQPSHADYSTQRFCSLRCQSIFYDLFTQEITVNKTDLETRAEQSVLIPLGDYVSTIGLAIPLRDYSKAQIEGLVKTVLDSYHTELQRLTENEIPF
jgi:endogenous inhibitor of DNA gyrase (YacG/DUF329 family)